MRHQPTLIVRVCTLVLSAAALAACSRDSTSPPATANVSMLDQCDSASFNAALGAGTCTRAGTTTFSAFNAELSATHAVAAWRFDPSSLAIHTGDRIMATNNGGEVHTFTEVAQFGGGVVPALNTASGNPTEAPECAAISQTDRLKPGSSKTTDPESTTGVHRYQCCIHPWMREVVTVSG